MSADDDPQEFLREVVCTVAAAASEEGKGDDPVFCDEVRRRMACACSFSATCRACGMAGPNVHDVPEVRGMVSWLLKYESVTKNNGDDAAAAAVATVASAFVYEDAMAAVEGCDRPVLMMIDMWFDHSGYPMYYSEETLYDTLFYLATVECRARGVPSMMVGVLLGHGAMDKDSPTVVPLEYGEFKAAGGENSSLLKRTPAWLQRCMTPYVREVHPERYELPENCPICLDPVRADNVETYSLCHELSHTLCRPCTEKVWEAECKGQRQCPICRR